MNMYTEEEFLQLSGIQHFCFCRRQWALIHIENLWTENYFTVDGNIVHEKVHNSKQSEKRGNILYIRGMYINSSVLGISGQCDLIEFYKDKNGINVNGYADKWFPVPVEYKRGKRKSINADRLQLCSQAMCLEEMLVCNIPYGFLYYNETREREKIEFTEYLRGTVTDTLREMHQYYHNGYTPKPKKKSACNSCSLKNDCLPTLERRKTADRYIKEQINLL